jgi:hypothetical protein
MCIKIATLKELLQHLLNNPGEFEWGRYCSIRNMGVVECALHRQWLREKGFTTVSEGKTYRTDKDLKALNAEFGQVPPPSPLPVRPMRLVDPDLQLPKSPIEVKIETPAPKKPTREPRQPKPRVTREPRQVRAKREKQVTELSRCCEIIRSLNFQNLNAIELAELIHSKSSIRFTIDVVDCAARMTHGVSACRIRGDSFLRYSSKAQ